MSTNSIIAAVAIIVVGGAVAWWYFGGQTADAPAPTTKRDGGTYFSKVELKPEVAATTRAAAPAAAR